MVIILNKDPFGILKLNPTSPNGFNTTSGLGWEYFSTQWNQNFRHEFAPKGFSILHDRHMKFKNVDGAYCIVRGDGRLTLGSENLEPMELWLYDDDNYVAGIDNALGLKRGFRWSSNVEFTIYFNRKLHSEATKKPTDGALSIHLTSDRHFLPNQNLCPFNTHEYILVIRNDGHMYFTGEPYHGSVRDAKPDGIMDINFWGTDFTGIPLDTDIGIKFVKRVFDTKNVFLEVYRDLTNGFEGGKWIKLFEFKHVRGNWYNESMDAPYQKSIENSQYCIIPPTFDVDDPHADMGGGMCYIKMTPVREIDLKWISCRDILPSLLPPVTTEDDLDESEPSGVDTEPDP